MKRYFFSSFFHSSCLVATAMPQDSKKQKDYPVSKTETEWKAELSPAAIQGS